MTIFRCAGSSSTISSTHSSGVSSSSRHLHSDSSHGHRPSTTCQKQLLTVGFIPPPSDVLTWAELDQQLGMLLEEYLHRIDPDMALGVDSYESIIGYEIHAPLMREDDESISLSCDDSPSTGRVGRWLRRRDSSGEESVWKTTADSEEEMVFTGPAEVFTAQSGTVIELRLKGVAQSSLDVLVMESLFPRSLLTQLQNTLLQTRRLLIHGSTGLGKSKIARHLARYISQKQEIPATSVVDIRFPDEDQQVERIQQAQQRLVEALRGGGLVLIDNLQPKRVQLVAEALNTTQSPLHDGPYIICTLNRSTDASVQALHTAHKFHLFALSHRLEAVRGFMTRYLRRRLAEAELNEHCQCGEQMRCVFDFLGKVLAKVNEVIERGASGTDVTVGPRTFLQCPLEMESSREWFVELWNAKIVPYMQKVGEKVSLIQ